MDPRHVISFWLSLIILKTLPTEIKQLYRKYIYIYIFTSLKTLIRVWRHFQRCEVRRFFRIPTPSHKLFKFKNRLRLATFCKSDSDSSNFENRLQTPTPAENMQLHHLRLHNLILSQVLDECNIAEDPLVRKDSLPCRNSMFELNNFSFLFSLIEHWD